MKTWRSIILVYPHKELIMLVISALGTVMDVQFVFSSVSLFVMAQRHPVSICVYAAYISTFYSHGQKRLHNWVVLTLNYEFCLLPILCF